MNPISVVVCMIIIICLAKSKNLKDFYIYILAFGIYATLFLRIGIFFNSSVVDIRHYEVLFYLSFLVSVLLIIKNGVKKRQMLLFMYLILFILINNLLLLLAPYAGKIITWTLSWDRDFYAGNLSTAHFTKATINIDITIIFFSFIVYAAIQNFDMKDITKILVIFVYLGFTVYFFSFIELLFKNFVSSELYYHILNSAFGVVGEPITTISRYGFNPIFGFCVEPQHFAKGLFVWMLAAYAVLKGKTKQLAFILFTITSILTTSFAALLYIGLVALLFIYESKQKILILGLVLLITGVFCMSNPRVFQAYISRFQNLFYLIFKRDHVVQASESTRIISIIETFRYFLNRPLWGIGIGTTYAHGAVTSLLSNIGILGALFWIALTNISMEGRKWIKKQKGILLVYLFAMVLTTTYWLAFFSLEYLLIILILKYVNYNLSMDTYNMCRGEQ